MKKITSSATAGIASHRIASQGNLRILERFLAMLTVCVVIFFGISSPRAQIQYNFQPPDQITISTAPVNLPMDCLSANGYGQWTSGPGTSGSANLLSNKLNSSALDNQQNGVLAYQPFAYDPLHPLDGYPSGDAIKCASNLKGYTRYVWLNAARTAFYVEGFNPGSGAGVDISFSTLPGNDSIVKTAPSLETYPSPGTLVVAPASAEPLGTADIFDVAIDADYLYIVWEQSTASPYSVWAMVIKLSNGALTMSPTQVTPVAGGGRRPTVAVDIRNSGSVGNFDVVCLSQDLGSASDNDSSNVWWTEYNGSSFSSPVTVDRNYTDPLHGSTHWIAPLHARILIASEAGVSPSTSNQRGIYIIAQNTVFSMGSYLPQLFLNYLFSGNGPVTASDYCDGSSNTVRPTGCPVETALAFPLWDNPIWAFANPYEGANSTNGALEFTEFHCLYQLNRTGGTNSPSSNKPLMIIRGDDLLNLFCVSGNTSTTFYDDPSPSGNNYDGYCGAVNQMGVHVHWCSGSKHYYRRDKREFDQSIEENTLLTDECDVGNSTSGVGSSSPELLPNLTLTLYGDPTTNSFYTGFGDLVFDNNATLNIGSSTDAGADFVSAGAFKVNGAGSWTLNFGAGNTWDYYGNNPGNSQLFGGTGSITMTGGSESTTSTTNTGGGDFVSSITNPVTVNLHPGTEFIIGPTSFPTTITATGAHFDFMRGTSVPHGTSGTADGSMGIDNNGTFTKCELFSDDATSGDPTIITIGKNGQFSSCGGSGDANYNGVYSSATNSTVSFTECFFRAGQSAGNTVGHAYLKMSGDESPSALTISEGRLSGWSVNGNPMDGSVSPWWPVSITQAQFDAIQQFGIDIDESNPFAGIVPCSIAQLYSILIDENDFQDFNLANHSNPDGIIISGAPDAISGSPTTFQDDLRQDITVTNNTFEHETGSTAGSIEAAIHFHQTTGDIGYNSITSALTSASSEYAIGIWNESGLTGTLPTTWTFICDNTVAGATTAGLSTNNYIGYVKLNTFEYNEEGQISGDNDDGHIDASYYTNSASYGYEGTSNSKTDLSGVHHDPLLAEPDDDGAYDTLTGNNSGGVQVGLTGCAGATIFLGLAPGSPSWTVYGENDIEGSPNQICSSCALSLNDVSNNYWNGGGYSFCSGTTGTGGYLMSKPSSSGWECSSGLITKKKVTHTLSVLDSGVDKLDSSTCLRLQGSAYFYSSLNGSEPQGYDTCKLFLEDCPMFPNSYETFSDIHAAVDLWNTGGQGRYADFLEFLKMVLYYNPDTLWYCDDVMDMLNATQNVPDNMSILLYIVQSGKCPGFTADFQQGLSGDSLLLHQEWLDSLGYAFQVKEDSLGMDGSSLWPDSIGEDTLAHPFTDTTVPTLFQDSLEILLGPQYAGVQSPSTITSQALLSAVLIENPVVADEIDISYQMGRTALVTMELRDVLGRMVPIANAKYQLTSPGPHEASIPAPSLPSGTYYLRLTTDAGDAITLKVVKE